MRAYMTAEHVIVRILSKHVSCAYVVGHVVPLFIALHTDRQISSDSCVVGSQAGASVGRPTVANRHCEKAGRRWRRYKEVPIVDAAATVRTLLSVTDTGVDKAVPGGPASHNGPQWPGKKYFFLLK